MSRLWDKGEPVDDLVLRFTVGDDFRLDARLVPYDIEASIAHANMLEAKGYLTAADAGALCDALRAIGREHAEGAWTIQPEEEDCHTALENRLVQRLPEAGARVHLGRSRNDQVLVALRLYLRDAVQELASLGNDVASALLALETRQGTLDLPGYTHQQRAMPSTVALWAGGFRSEIEDDVLGLSACSRRLLRNPLGSAAGYGTPGLVLDRDRTTRDLGFAQVHDPVTAVQLSRGKAEATVLFELSLLAQDVGRLASDLCLFTTKEFGFVTLPLAFTTGSSIMPQKRNPDVFELVRGRATQVPSDLMAVLALTSKMTSGYHRDLQLIKAPLFRSMDSVADMLRVMSHALAGVRFEAARMKEALDPSLYATERAYELVRDRNIPFREAYRQVAKDLGF